MDKILVWTITSAGLQTLQLQPWPQTPDQASGLLPGGAYTTFCTYGRTHALRLEGHFDRLEETAQLAGQLVELDRAHLRGAMRQAIQQAPGWADLRLRLTIDLEQQIGQAYLIAAELHTPAPEVYRQGVRVVTVPFQRLNPKAKLTGAIQRAEQVRTQLPPGVHEAVMLTPEGQLLEGLSSNFFAVKDNQVWTAEEGVLSGITRSLVLEEIRRVGIPLNLAPVTLDDLPSLSEAFITSVSRAVLPVRQVDEQIIGGGSPGLLTGRILTLYRQRLQAELEPI